MTMMMLPFNYFQCVCFRDCVEKGRRERELKKYWKNLVELELLGSTIGVRPDLQ